VAEFRLSNFTSGNALTAAELNTGLTYADYTPTWTQSVAITKTVDWARYTVFGKLVHASIKMTSSGAGTANNKILVGLPVNASSNNLLMGITNFVDSGLTNAYNYAPRSVFYESASTIGFSTTNSAASNDKRWGEDFTISNNTQTGFTIASGDILYVQITYEAA
jgi:hypothetical protein